MPTIKEESEAEDATMELAFEEEEEPGKEERAASGTSSKPVASACNRRATCIKPMPALGPQELIGHAFLLDQLEQG